MSTSILRGRDTETLLSIDLTGVTALTLAAEQMRAGSLVFTGSPSGAVTVTVPVAVEDDGAGWTLANRTGQPVTFQAPAGDGAVVPAGASVRTLYDGAAMAAVGAPASGLGTSAGETAVVITDPEEGDTLLLVGDAWTNVPLVLDTLTDVDLTGAAEGELIYFDGLVWRNLPVGTAGFVLSTQGTGEPPEWISQPEASLAGALIVDPSTSNRNTVVPDADAVRPLAVQAFSATQTADLFAALGADDGVRFAVAADGALTVAPAAATVGSTTEETAGLELLASYWDGAVAQSVAGSWRLRLDDDTPTWYLAGRVDGEDVLLLRGDGTVLVNAVGQALPTLPTEEFQVNATTRFLRDLALADNVSVALGEAVGTQWGTAPTQLQGWWGAAPVVQAAPPTGTVEQKIDALIALLVTYGLLTGEAAAPALWRHYDASTLVGLGDFDPVTTWPDESGEGFDMAAVTAPTYYDTAVTQNGLPVVSFEFGDEQLTTTEAVGTPRVSYSIYCVVSYLKAQTESAALVRATSNDTAPVFVKGNAWSSHPPGANGRLTFGSPDAIAGHPAAVDGAQILSVHLDHIAETGDIRRNDTELGAFTYSVAVGQTDRQWALGFAAAEQGFVGLMMEIKIYRGDRPHDAGERAAEVAALNAKWDIF